MAAKLVRLPGSFIFRSRFLGFAVPKNLLSAHFAKTPTIPRDSHSGWSFRSRKTMELFGGERIRLCDNRARFGATNSGKGFPHGQTELLGS